MRVSFDASEVDGLVHDLRRVPSQVEHRARDVVRKKIDDVTKGWQRRARVSAGKHGKLYPGTIRAEILGGELEAETGPVSSLPQGGMGRGFEWGGPSVIRNATGGWFIGSEKYPPPGEWRTGGFEGQRVGQTRPHLDMSETMDEEEPRFVEAAGGAMLPWW